MQHDVNSINDDEIRVDKITHPSGTNYEPWSKFP